MSSSDRQTAGSVVHPRPVTGVERWSTRCCIDGGPRPRARALETGLVHRLDKETSGVLLIAKDEATLADLGRQFRSARDREELPRDASGACPARRGSDRPAHRAASDSAEGEWRFGHAGAGRRAAARYSERLSRRRAPSRPSRDGTDPSDSGSSGVDRLSGRRRRGVFEAPQRVSRGGHERQALHAESITFRHPSTGAAMTLSAPLPEDFALALRHGCARSLDIRRSFQ